MINKEEMLKLASELEALTDQDLSEIDANSLYKELQKEASLSVDELGIQQAIISCIDSMGRYTI